jgi:hypothetical protein
MYVIFEIVLRTVRPEIFLTPVCDNLDDCDVYGEMV